MTGSTVSASIRIAVSGGSLMHPAEAKVRKIITSEVKNASGEVLSWGGNARLGEAVISRGGNVVRVLFVRRARQYDIPGLVGRVRRAVDQKASSPIVTP